MNVERGGPAASAGLDGGSPQDGGFVAEMRLGLGPAAPTLVLGITFGAAAHAAGWGSAAPLVFSMLALGRCFLSMTHRPAGRTRPLVGEATGSA